MVSILDYSTQFVKTKCPSCKSEIKAIKNNTNIATWLKEEEHEVPICLLGCSECKIVFWQRQ